MFWGLLLLAVLSIVVMLSIVFSTIYTGISPMPSSSKERLAMLELIEEVPRRIVVLGSGWGGLAKFFARAYPSVPVQAYEYSIFPFLFSKWTVREPNVQLIQKNFLQVTLPEEALFLTYLYPAGMIEVRALLKDKQGWLLSNTFGVHQEIPIRKIRVDNRHKSYVYLYRLTRG